MISWISSRLDRANTSDVNNSGYSLNSGQFIMFLISSTLFLPIAIDIISFLFFNGIFNFSRLIILFFGTPNILVTLLITSIP